MCENQPSATSRMKRICLFGGTFDPIHLGHQHIAAAAQKAMQLDQVLFLPCKQSPHKADQSLATESQRLEMCNLATENLPWAKVDDHDLKAPSPSYSWRTAESLKSRFPEAKLFWLMGTDQWDALPQWNRADYLATLVDFIVFSRGTQPKPRPNITMHPIQGHHPASATQIRQAAPERLQEPWLHKKVIQYIQSQQLYSS